MNAMHFRKRACWEFCLFVCVLIHENEKLRNSRLTAALDGDPSSLKRKLVPFVALVAFVPLVLRRSQLFSVCVVNDVTEFLRVSSSPLSHPGSIPGGSVASDEEGLCCADVLVAQPNLVVASLQSEAEPNKAAPCLFVLCFF